MGNASAIGRVGILLAISFVASLIAACGEVTANGAEETQVCAKKTCAGKDCPRPDQKTEQSDAGMGCTTNSGGAAASPTSGGAGTAGAGGAVPTEVAEFPCLICRRAENCCRAEGLTDCGYTAACASAMNAQQMEFYVAFCRAVLDASASGGKRPPDVCGP